MENFVILAKLPSPWPTTTQGGDGGRTPTPSRSPVKLFEEAIDNQGGTVQTVAGLEGRHDMIVICSLPNHEAAVKVAFTLNQYGIKTETSVAIDAGNVEHAWTSVQQQLAEARRR